MGWVLLEIIIPLLLAVLLGLFLGWLLWRWRRDRVTYSEWETDASSEVSALSDAAASEWQADKAAAAAASEELAGLKKELANSTTQVGALESELEADRRRLASFGGLAGVAGVAAGRTGKPGEPDADSVRSRLTELHQQVGTARARVSELEGPLKAASSRSVSLEGELRTATVRIKSLQTELAETKARLTDAEDRTEAQKSAAVHARPLVGGLVGATLAPHTERHPFGVGSHGPLVNRREMPAGYPIRATTDSKLYHRPDSQRYVATIADVWFVTVEGAEAAGFKLAPTHPTTGS
ncbi:MAG: hypothetical protein ACI8TP_002842 [Acidimicrobiales bacterium]|jgi:hypothetical protein